MPSFPFTFTPSSSSTRPSQPTHTSEPSNHQRANSPINFTAGVPHRQTAGPAPTPAPSPAPTPTHTYIHPRQASATVPPPPLTLSTRGSNWDAYGRLKLFITPPRGQPHCHRLPFQRRAPEPEWEWDPEPKPEPKLEEEREDEVKDKAQDEAGYEGDFEDNAPLRRRFEELGLGRISGEGEAMMGRGCRVKKPSLKEREEKERERMEGLKRKRGGKKRGV
ncbi:MAG: hypothetical protein MMC23_006524 [Stictis urceolatum]|nr:hypothetical protein [Stictis urceolata]